MELNDILKVAVQGKASDVHVKANAPPRVRIRNQVVPLEHPPLSAEFVTTMVQALATFAGLSFCAASNWASCAVAAPAVMSDVTKSATNVLMWLGRRPRVLC